MHLSPGHSRHSCHDTSKGVCREAEETLAVTTVTVSKKRHQNSSFGFTHRTGSAFRFGSSAAHVVLFTVGVGQVTCSQQIYGQNTPWPEIFSAEDQVTLWCLLKGLNLWAQRKSYIREPREFIRATWSDCKWLLTTPQLSQLFIATDFKTEDVICLDALKWREPSPTPAQGSHNSPTTVSYKRFNHNMAMPYFEVFQTFPGQRLKWYQLHKTVCQKPQLGRFWDPMKSLDLVTSARLCVYDFLTQICSFILLSFL